MNLNRFVQLCEEIVPNENGCRIWPHGKTSAGYPILKLQETGKVTYGHRLALEIRLGRPLQPGMWALHECDNPACIEHLEEGTQRKNVEDAVTRGRMASGDRNGSRTKPERKALGSRNGRSILSEEQVIEVVKLHKEGLSLRKINKLMGCLGAAGDIVRGTNWSHLTGIKKDRKDAR